MKSDPSHRRSKLRRHVSACYNSFRYLGREGVWLTREMARAKRFQQGGNVEAMWLSLDGARDIASRIRGQRTKFASGWKNLVEYELALFDIPAAARTVARAMEFGLTDSPDTAANVERISLETQAWNDNIVEAGANLRDRSIMVKPTSDTLLILLPSTAFGLDTPSEPTLRKSLRFIFREIIATCRENSIAYEVRGRLANHGTPQVENGRLYISHHSVGPDGRGLHIKATDRPSCFSFDSLGYSGWSKFAATPLQELGLEGINTNVQDFNREKERIILGNVSKYQQSASDTVLSGKYVFVGLQKPGDAVQQLARMPMLEMLREVVGTCRERGIAVVVKRHPKCTSGEIARELDRGVKAGIYHVSNASIHDLIAGSCAVCVVNSSVGAEALLHEKPVYLFGAAEYQHVCFRINAAGDFAKVFRPDELPVTPEILRRFLHLLRHEYAVDVTNHVEAKAYIHRKVLGHVTR